MEYPKAEYQKVMCCPECGFNKGTAVESGRLTMPDRHDFMRKDDHIECPCGCKFVEE